MFAVTRGSKQRKERPCDTKYTITTKPGPAPTAATQGTSPVGPQPVLPRAVPLPPYDPEVVPQRTYQVPNKPAVPGATT